MPEAQPVAVAGDDRERRAEWRRTERPTRLGHLVQVLQQVHADAARRRFGV
jgi:hypothetical protein